jgi:hypothetical protein
MIASALLATNGLADGDRAIADKLGALMRAAETFNEPVAEVVSIERK